MGYKKEGQQLYVFHFDTTAEMLAYPFVPEDLGATVFDDQLGNVYTCMGSGIAPALCSQLGSIRQVPKQVVYASAITLDLSQSNSWQMTDIVTADFALTLTNGKDGDCGTFIFKQAAAGGKKITGITVSGRTKEMDDALTTINTTNMLVANNKCILTYALYTSVDACVRFWMNTGAALAVT
jgi:hypothetical protein